MSSTAGFSSAYKGYVGWRKGGRDAGVGVVSDIPNARLVEMERRANIRSRDSNGKGGLPCLLHAFEYGGRHISDSMREDTTKVYGGVRRL